MAVGFRKRVKYNKGPSRRTQQAVPGARNNLQPGIPITIDTMTKDLAVVTVTFTTPVILTGIPAWNEDDSSGAIPISATLDTTNTIMTLTYPATPTDAINIPFQDPGVRNNSAGYVTQGLYPLPFPASPPPPMAMAAKSKK